MWRLRFIAILGVVTGVLVFGAVVAQGSWWWNSKIDVQGVELATRWEITDTDKSLFFYRSDIVVTVPKQADAVVIERASNEKVTIEKSKKLKCLAEGIQVKVEATVSGPGGTSKLTITANGDVVGGGTAPVGDTIKDSVLLPGTCDGGSSASGSGDGDGDGKKGKKGKKDKDD